MGWAEGWWVGTTPGHPKGFIFRTNVEKCRTPAVFTGDTHTHVTTPQVVSTQENPTSYVLFDLACQVTTLGLL